MPACLPCVSFTRLWLQIKFQPFRQWQDNALELSLLIALFVSYLSAIVAKSANTLGGVEVVVTVVQWLAVVLMAVAPCHGYVLRAVKAAGCIEPEPSADNYQLLDGKFTLNCDGSPSQLSEST